MSLNILENSIIEPKEMTSKMSQITSTLQTLNTTSFDIQNMTSDSSEFLKKYLLKINQISEELLVKIDKKHSDFLSDSENSTLEKNLLTLLPISLKDCKNPYFGNVAFDPITQDFVIATGTMLVYFKKGNIFWKTEGNFTDVIFADSQFYAWNSAKGVYTFKTHQDSIKRLVECEVIESDDKERVIFKKSGEDFLVLKNNNRISVCCTKVLSPCLFLIEGLRSYLIEKIIPMSNSRFLFAEYTGIVYIAKMTLLEKRRHKPVMCSYPEDGVKVYGLNKEEETFENMCLSEDEKHLAVSMRILKDGTSLSTSISVFRVEDTSKLTLVNVLDVFKYGVSSLNFFRYSGSLNGNLIFSAGIYNRESWDSFIELCLNCFEGFINYKKIIKIGKKRKNLICSFSFNPETQEMKYLEELDYKMEGGNWNFYECEDGVLRGILDQRDRFRVKAKKGRKRETFFASDDEEDEFSDDTEKSGIFEFNVLGEQFENFNN